MKKVMSLLVLLVILQTVQAQTWSEWFKQKKTQIKYLTQQIIALKMYAGYLEKGYEIAKDGLTVINDIKNGDFNVHNRYFQSLKQINIGVKDEKKLNAIFRLRGLIEVESASVRKVLRSDNSFPETDIIYAKKVIARLSELADADVDHLQVLMEKGGLEMKDDERWKRIEQVLEEMTDKYAFIRYFGNEVKTLVVQREREQVEVERLKAEGVTRSIGNERSFVY